MVESFPEIGDVGEPRKSKLRSFGLALLSAAMLTTILAAPASAQGGATCDGIAATIVGTNGPDTLVGTDGVDVIAGLGGNDFIDGLDGNDVLCGDDGNDTVRGGRGEDFILGGEGNDNVRGQQNADTIDGGDGNDTVRGNNGADLIWGRSGEDTLLGGRGQDIIRGGADADEIGGGNHDDTIFGGAGDDSLRGGNGSDEINSGAGDDDIRGGIGDDDIRTDGSTGDVINPGLGDDLIDGVSEDDLPPPPPPSAGLFFHEDFGGETFSGEVYGLVEVPLSEFGPDDVGTCYLLVGEITPLNVTGLLSSGFDTPRMGVIAGGEYIEDSVSCDRGQADDLGYSWILRTEATSGTDIPFYAEIFVPEGQGVITDIVIGNPNNLEEVAVIDPTVLDAIPVPSGLTVGVLPNGPAVGPNATFEYTEPSGDASWTGEITSVVTAPLSRFTQAAGRCFLVLGTLTPTVIDGGLVSDRFSTPDIGALVDGRHIDDGTECDTDAVEAQGFDWILNAEVTLGTEYRFYAEIFIPEVRTGEPTRIVVGRPSDENARFFVN